MEDRARPIGYRIRSCTVITSASAPSCLITEITWPSPPGEHEFMRLISVGKPVSMNMKHCGIIQRDRIGATPVPSRGPRGASCYVSGASRCHHDHSCLSYLAVVALLLGSLPFNPIGVPGTCVVCNNLYAYVLYPSIWFSYIWVPLPGAAVKNYDTASYSHRKARK